VEKEDVLQRVKEIVEGEVDLLNQHDLHLDPDPGGNLKVIETVKEIEEERVEVPQREAKVDVLAEVPHLQEVKHIQDRN
jgi:hypothetical protein